MSEQTPEIVTDEQLASFVREGQTLREAEAVLEAGLADLCARPFDQASQEEMRRLLDSDQLREATLIARRMGGQDR